MHHHLARQMRRQWLATRLPAWPETDIKGRTADQRWMQRQTRSKPLLDAYYVWAIAQRRRLSGKTPLGKALQYGLSRWDALTRYIDDGRLSIDNNR
jgi:hypothetical protein